MSKHGKFDIKVYSIFFLVFLAMVTLVASYTLDVNSPSANTHFSNATLPVNISTNISTPAAIGGLNASLLNVTWAPQGGTAFVDACSATGANFTVYSCVWTPYINGTVTLNISVYNSTNNVLLNHTTVSISIDSTIPTSVLNLPADNSWSTTPVVTFNSTGNDVNISTFVLWANFSGSWVANTTVSNLTTGVSNATTFNLSDGVYVWNVIYNDTSGNSAFNTSNSTISVDTVNPTTTLNGPASGNYTNSNSVTFNFTGTDNNLDWWVLWGNFSGSWAANVSNGTTSSGVYNLSTVTIPDGYFVWNVVFNDSAGNSAFAAANYTLFVDGSPPVITVNAPTNAAWVNTRTPLINVTIQDSVRGLANTTFNITINQTVLTYPTSFVCSITITSLLTNATVCTFNSISLAEGTTQLNISVLDGFGHVGTSNTTIQTDVVNPVVALHSPANNNYTNSNSVTFNATGTDANIDSYVVWGNFSGSWAANVTGTSITSGLHNVTTLTLADGTYIWNVQYNDSAANSVSNKTNYTISVDTTPPSITLNSPINGLNTSSSTVTVNFTLADNVRGIDNSTISATVNTSIYNYPTNISCTSTVTTNFPNAVTCSFTSQSFQNGTYLVNISVNDGFGNYNSSNTTYTIDSVAPTVAPNFTVSDVDTDGNLNLSWTAISGVYKYGIFRSLSLLNNTIMNGTRLANTTANTFIDNTSSHGVKYWYAVTSIDYAGNENSSFANIINVSNNGTSNDAIIPKVPASVTVTNSSNTAYISWYQVLNDISSNPDFTGLEYHVWNIVDSLNISKNTSAAGMTNIANLTHPTNSTTWSVPSNCTTSCRYIFAVSSKDDGNNSNETIVAYANVTLKRSAAAEETTTSSSGGGGGGGIVSPTVTNVIAKVSKGWGTVTKGAEQTMTINNKDIAVQDIKFTTTTNLNNPSLDVSSLSSLTDVGAVTGEVYQYLDIKASNLARADLSSVKIQFKIPFSWFNQNNLKRVNVKLARYVNGWTLLPTEEVKADNTHAYFEATSPGFSYFAIIAEREEVAEEPVPEGEAPTEAEEAPTEEGEEALDEDQAEKRSLAWLWWLIGVVVLVVAVYLYKSSRKSS